MPEFTMTVDEHGVITWKNKTGKFHCSDVHVIECPDGTKKWCQNGKYHRTDGPAIEWNNGTKMWYQHGDRHRVDGPAIEYVSGLTVWFYNNKHLDRNLKGFWSLWNLLSDEERQNVNLHMWLLKLTSG